MRIATWNVNSLRVRLPHLLQWLESTPVDVLALQETKIEDANFPCAELEAAGFHVVFNGQRTYNGVALMSRTAMADVVRGIPDLADDQRRVIAATISGVRVIDVYVPNGQAVDSEKFVYKLRWLEALEAYVAAELIRHERLVLLGDFNIAPEDRDVHDPQAWEGSVHVSEPERSALRRIVGLGLCDVFRSFEQPDRSYSWWDYRAGAFRRNHGLRIDLVLASNAIAAECDACLIDKAPRTWERPSDHAPVVASFDIAGD
ncbi:MAG TPA: exodeoxyribonuclease III [Steroidobacteraceae bacterium]|nr:exodeoxyribonuclease III [Steroidobacteraceae bacterium]